MWMARQKINGSCNFIALPRTNIPCLSQRHKSAVVTYKCAFLSDMDWMMTYTVLMLASHAAPNWLQYVHKPHTLHVALGASKSEMLTPLWTTFLVKAASIILSRNHSAFPMHVRTNNTATSVAIALNSLWLTFLVRSKAVLGTSFKMK